MRVAQEPIPTPRIKSGGWPTELMDRAGRGGPRTFEVRTDDARLVGLGLARLIEPASQPAQDTVRQSGASLARRQLGLWPDVRDHAGASGGGPSVARCGSRHTLARPIVGIYIGP